MKAILKSSIYGFAGTAILLAVYFSVITLVSGWAFALNQFVMDVAPALAEAPNHPVAQGAFEGPIWLGWWTWIGVILLSVFWNWFKKKKISLISFIISLLLVILGFLSLTGVIGAKPF